MVVKMVIFDSSLYQRQTSLKLLKKSDFYYKIEFIKEYIIY